MSKSAGKHLLILRRSVDDESLVEINLFQREWFYNTVDEATYISSIYICSESFDADVAGLLGELSSVYQLTLIVFEKLSR